MAQKKPAKKRNQADATLRNTRAANRRLTTLEAAVKRLIQQHYELEQAVVQNAQRLVAVEARVAENDPRPYPPGKPANS